MAAHFFSVSVAYRSFILRLFFLTVLLYYCSLLIYVSIAPNIQYKPPPMALPKLSKREISKYSDSMAVFKKHWKLVSKARIHWRATLSPCVGNMKARNVIQGSQMKTSSQESYIEFITIRPAGEFSTLRLRTRTKSGEEKRFGGDFWKVILFKGPSSVYATVFDNNDGSYEAMALLMEPGQYNVEVILMYTMCEGLEDPPKGWIKEVVHYYGIQNLGPPKNVTNALIFQRLGKVEKFVVHVPPTDAAHTKEREFEKIVYDTNCKKLWNGLGRWVEGKWLSSIASENIPFTSTAPVSKRLGTLWLFGDSLVYRFSKAVSTKALCKKIFLSCRNSYNWMYPVSKFRKLAYNESFSFRPEVMLDAIREVLKDFSMKSNRSVLVLNLGLHFALGVKFSVFQDLMKDVIKLLKSRNQLGCKAQVIWRSSTAIYKERAKPKAGGTGREAPVWRYFTPQRVELYDKYAMSVMCEAGFQVLDVYHLSASHPRGANDVAHYSNDVFYPVEKLLEQYAIHKMQRS